MFLQKLVDAFSALAGEPLTKKPTPTDPIKDALIIDNVETPPKKVTTVFLDFPLFVRKTNCLFCEFAF